MKWKICEIKLLPVILLEGDLYTQAGGKCDMDVNETARRHRPSSYASEWSHLQTFMNMVILHERRRRAELLRASSGRLCFVVSESVWQEILFLNAQTQRSLSSKPSGICGEQIDTAIELSSYRGHFTNIQHSSLSSRLLLFWSRFQPLLLRMRRLVER